MVVFAGMEFIFRFLPIFMVIFYVVPKRFRETVLLLGSIVFYAVGELRFLPVLLGTIGINYVLGNIAMGNRAVGYANKNIGKTTDKIAGSNSLGSLQRKSLVITAIILDVAVLILFKVLSVTVDSQLLPLGISFYMFKMISYQADLLRGEIWEKPSIKDTALYFCMFPQVISGPVMRYGEGDFGTIREYRLEKLEEGFQYFILGFGMKVLLADRLAIFWSDMQMIGFANISTPLAWLGMFSYSLRLYFDFWGYSLMAAGIGVMVGFPFIRNFDHPYAARSISEFYRRWHMTLGSWFRDYVYIPMGGSRVGTGRIVLNLLAVWLLTGIWHGSGINFCIWGVLLGIFVVNEKLWLGKLLQKIPLLGNLYVLLFIPLTWVVFAISDLKQLGIYFSRLFPFFGQTESYINQRDFINYLQSYGGLFLIGMVLCIPWVSEYYKKHRKNILIILLLLTVFWLGVYFIVSQEGNPFMYFKF